MRRRLIWIGTALLLVMAYVAYRSSHRNDKLNVEPHAARAIERAKKR